MLNFQCTVLHKSFRLYFMLSLVWFVIQTTNVLILPPSNVLTWNIIARPTHMTTTRLYYNCCRYFFSHHCCCCWHYLYDWTKEPVVADTMLSPDAVNDTKTDGQVPDHEVSSLSEPDHQVELSSVCMNSSLSVCHLHFGLWEYYKFHYYQVPKLWLITNKNPCVTDFILKSSYVFSEATKII